MLHKAASLLKQPRFNYLFLAEARFLRRTTVVLRTTSVLADLRTVFAFALLPTLARFAVVRLRAVVFFFFVTICSPRVVIIPLTSLYKFRLKKTLLLQIFLKYFWNKKVFQPHAALVNCVIRTGKLQKNKTGECCRTTT
jgi:hypothetical protein